MGLSANAQHSRGLSSRCVTTTRRAGLAVRPTTCTIFAKKHSLPLVAKDGTAPITLPPALAGVRLLDEAHSSNIYLLIAILICHYFSNPTNESNV